MLGVVLVALRDKPWLDPQAFGLAVAVGTVAWTVVHARRVWTAQSTTSTRRRADRALSQILCPSWLGAGPAGPVPADNVRLP